MVENLIAGYLATGKRLVIPELGAFLKKDTGETVFVEYLKKDDGVFAGHISQSLGISVVEAGRLANQLTADVKTSLSGKGFFIIPNVGTMRRDASGSITLTPSFSEEPQVPQKPVEEPVQHPAQPVEAKPVPERPKVVQYREAPQPEQATPPTPRPLAAETTTVPVTPSPRQTTPSPSVRPAAKQPEAPLVRPVARPQAEASPFREEQPRRVHRPPVNVPQKKKKTDLVMIIAVIAALVAIGSMVYGLLVNNDPIMNLQPTSPQVEQVVDTEDITVEAAE